MSHERARFWYQCVEVILSTAVVGRLGEKDGDGFWMSEEKHHNAIQNPNCVSSAQVLFQQASHGKPQRKLLREARFYSPVKAY